MRKYPELALSGGAARGAYQFALVKTLIENGYEFGHISGTSIGAINAYLLSSDLLDTGEYIWKEEVPKLFGRREKIQAIFRGATMKDGLFSPEPITSMLNRFVNLKAIRKPFTAYCVDAEGSVIGFRSNMFTNDDQLREALRGAVAIPGVFPPVNYVYNLEGEYNQLIDAGVRALIPPYDIGKKRMVVTVRNDLSKIDYYPGGTWIDNLLRTYELMTGEIARGDLLPDDLVISPTPELSPPYDFTLQAIERNWNIGVEQAGIMIRKDTHSDTSKR